MKRLSVALALVLTFASAYGQTSYQYRNSDGSVSPGSVIMGSDGSGHSTPIGTATGTPGSTAPGVVVRDPNAAAGAASAATTATNTAATAASAASLDTKATTGNTNTAATAASAASLDTKATAGNTNTAATATNTATTAANTTTMAGAVTTNGGSPSAGVSQPGCKAATAPPSNTAGLTYQNTCLPGGATATTAVDPSGAVLDPTTTNFTSGFNVGTLNFGTPISVGTTATLILAAQTAGTVHARIFCNESATIYIRWGDTTVSSSKGFELGPKACYQFDNANLYSEIDAAAESSTVNVTAGWW